MALVVREVGGRQVIRTQVHLAALLQQILVAVEGDILIILQVALAALAALVL